MAEVKKTTGAGDFYASIWTPAGTPASGDQLHISHVVTWTPNVSDMWLGSGVGHSLAFGSAGKLNLTPSGNFNLHLMGATGSGNITQFEFVADSTSGTININFDATLNSAGFQILTGNTYDANNRGGWDLRGNATYPINVQSIPTDNSKNSYFAGIQPGGGNVNANYVNFYRLGGPTLRAFYPQCFSTRQPTINFTNVVVSGCGEYLFNADVNYTGIVNFRNVKWINPTVDNTTYYTLNLNFLSDNGPPRLFSGCVIPSYLKTIHPRNVFIDNCLIESGIISAATNARWSGIHRSFIHTGTAMVTNPITSNGNITKCIFFWDDPATLNHHFLSQSTAPPTGSYTLWSGNVFYTNSLGADGNCMLTVGNSSRTDIVYNIIMPNASGISSGALSTATARVWGTGIIVIRNNTANVAMQHGLETGHLLGAAVSNVTEAGGTYTVTTDGSENGYQTGDSITIVDVGGAVTANGTWTITRTNGTTFTFTGPPGASAYTSGGETWNRENPNRYADVSNNIFWGNGTGFAGRNTHTSSFEDIIPPANIKKNASFAVAASSVDGTSLARFTNQGNSWSAKYSTTPGATDFTNTNPQFVNSGVSLSAWAVTKGSAGGTLAAREADCVKYIRDDITLIDDLTNYIFNGYKVQNAALHGTGDGGLDVGAAGRYESQIVRKYTFLSNGGKMTGNIKSGGSLI